MGTVMGVVQVTVQNAAGTASLGLGRRLRAAVALDRRGRRHGAGRHRAVCVPGAGAAPTRPGVFRALVDQGPATLATPAARPRAVIQSEIARAFRAGFLTIAAFAAIGVALAWSIPARRL